MLALVLAAMAVGTLVIGPFLNQASTTLLTSRDHGQAIIRQYSADAGVEHATWRLKYEPGFAGSLTLANPTVNYPVTVNNSSVNIDVTLVQVEFPPQPQPPPEGPEADRLQVSKSVAPESPPAGQLTTFTYTVSVKNVDTSTIKLANVRDLLPAGFSYVPGSSSGITTANPVIELVAGQQELKWIFSPPRPSISAGGTRALDFQATATPQVDFYWNEAWVELAETGIGIVGTGSTAPVRGGGISFYAYDVVSNAGGTVIRARVTIADSGVAISSWRVE